MWRFIFLSSVFLIFCGSSFAEDLSSAIRNYNQAIQSGDRGTKVDAARALGSAAIQAPRRDDTRVLVFEAAQTLALNGSENAAVDLAAWLASETGTSDSPIAQMDVDLLVSFIQWSDKPNKNTRRALDAALEQVAPLDPTLLTLFVFQERYVSDLNNGEFRTLHLSSLAAANHLGTVKHLVGEAWSNAAIIAHSSAFNRSTDAESLFAMASHYVELQKMHSKMHETSEDHPEWIDKHMHLAETWQLAMDAYFDSTQFSGRVKARDQKLEEILNWERPVKEPAQEPADAPAEDERLRLCAGSFEMTPELEYPREASRDGLVGAVMLSVDLTEGQVSDVEILAAIPAEGFAEETIETVKKWQWVVDTDRVEEPCTLDAQGIRWPFTFMLTD